MKFSIHPILIQISHQTKLTVHVVMTLFQNWFIMVLRIRLIVSAYTSCLHIQIYTCPLCLEKAAFSYSWDLVAVCAGGGGGKDENAELVLDTSVQGGE